MNFDSSNKNPIQDSVDIILNYKFSNHASRKLKGVDYYRGQMLLVLNERLIKGTTLKKIGEMLSVGQNRIRQIEEKLKRILIRNLKGYRWSIKKIKY